MEKEGTPAVKKRDARKERRYACREGKYTHKGGRETCRERRNAHRERREAIETGWHQAEVFVGLVWDCKLKGI